MGEGILSLKQVRANSLKQVRAKLGSNMEQRDHGFYYESLFRHGDIFSPHVRVRVELRDTDISMYHFLVFVDYQLPLGVGVEHAKCFKKLVDDATDKAIWAEGVVGGLSWSERELIMSKDQEYMSEEGEMNREKKFHIIIEVAKVYDPQFKRREYEVIAKTRIGAERKALSIAKEEWFEARLPEDKGVKCLLQTKFS